MDRVPTLLYFVITCHQPILLMYLAHWGQHKMDAILQTAFCWVKIHELWLKFCWSLFLTTQLTIFQHLFRLWLGTDPATSHYLSQMVSLLMHICITLPPWVKDCFTGTGTLPGTLPARRCHGMEILSMFLTFVIGIQQSMVDSSHKGPYYKELWCVLFVIRLNKLLNKQLSCHWFKTPWHSYDIIVMCEANLENKGKFII